MRSLGSNFLLNGESLGITIKKPFEILIKNKDLIRDENNGVEPFETSNTIWWARRESNPH
jgi:hypothetical protein